MKGRVVLLDHVDGRQAAALMVDGRLEDLLIDAPDALGPSVGAIARARVDRPMKGQGGLTLQLGDGRTGYLRRAGRLQAGETLLVQVSSIAEPGKAVPVTPDVVLKSRYAIVTPFAPGINVSRAIRDDDERDRLLEIAHSSRVVGTGFGLILRSAAAEVTAEAILTDIDATVDQATRLFDRVENAPEWLAPAPQAHLVAWRDWVDPDPDEVVDRVGCFEDYGVAEAVDAMIAAEITLGAGGTVWIEPTHAMVTVDVNTGADMSMAAGLKANLALARVLPRLLRIKGLGGQITLDLAPMPKKERRGFEAALRKAFRNDGADVVLAGWTPLGNFELQKKRDRRPLAALWPRSV